MNDEYQKTLTKIHNCSILLPTLEAKSIDKNEIIKWFTNNTTRAEEHNLIVNDQLNKFENDILSIKTTLNQNDIKNKGNIN